MKIEEIIALTDADIVKEFKKKEMLFRDWNFKINWAGFKQFSIRKIKRTIAKMKTILRQRELATKNAK